MKTAIWTCTLLCVLLGGCASGTAIETGTTEGTVLSEHTEATAGETALSFEPTRAQRLNETLHEVNYGDLFTIQIPESWQLSAGGTEMFLWLRAYDPAEPTLQVYATLKTGYFLKNQSAKQFYQNAYQMTGNKLLYGETAALQVLEPATLEHFYQNYMEYISIIAEWEPTFAGFEYPQIDQFETMESMPVNNELSSIALDNQMIRGSFVETLSRQKGEGMFGGTVVDLISMMDPGYDCGFDTIYNLTAITAPYGMLGEYEELLTQIIRSVNYTDTYVTQVMQAQQITMENARQVAAMTAESSRIITDGWNARQKTYDIKSQEYSDATLGYDRYLDTETNQVYRAELGVMDGYDGTRYQKLDQGSPYYTEPVAGYILK